MRFFGLERTSIWRKVRERTAVCRSFSLVSKGDSVMTLVAWALLVLLAFTSLAWARNQLQLSVYYLGLAAFAGSLVLGEEQMMLLTQFFTRFGLAEFIVAFVVSTLGMAFVISGLNRKDIQSVFEPAEAEGELEFEAQPAAV